MPLARFVRVYSYVGSGPKYHRDAMEFMQSYENLALQFLSSRGYSVQHHGLILKFEEKKLNLLERLGDMIAGTAEDGTYYENPITMAYGVGHVKNFIDVNKIGMEGALTFCISDISVIKCSLDSLSYPWYRFSSPEVVWISLRGMRRLDWPTEERFLKVLEDEISRSSGQE